MSVEGYTPKTESHHEKKPEEEEPLVFSSLSDLMEKAGTLPDQDPSVPPQMVEADLSFSVMSPEEYDTLKKEETDDNSSPALEEEEEAEDEQQQQQQPSQVFQGRYDIFSDDDEDEEGSDYYSDDEEVNVDDPVHDHHVEQSMPEPEPRAFMRIWSALAQWLTPEGVELLDQWRLHKSSSTSPTIVATVERSDVAASRCAGLMAMMQLQWKRCIKELLLQPEANEMLAKQRLAEFLQTLNYSRPTPRLDTRLCRVLLIVLVRIVLHLGVDQQQQQLPASVVAVGMNQDEYRYLCTSAIQSLAAGSG